MLFNESGFPQGRLEEIMHEFEALATKRAEEISALGATSIELAAMESYLTGAIAMGFAGQRMIDQATKYQAARRERQEKMKDPALPVNAWELAVKSAFATFPTMVEVAKAIRLMTSWGLKDSKEAYDVFVSKGVYIEVNGYVQLKNSVALPWKLVPDNK